MSDYICHKAVGPDKVTPKTRREELTSEYISTNYYAQAKHDGCHAVVFLYNHGGVEVKSRTGESYVSCLGAASALYDGLRDSIALHDGLVLFAEAWWPGEDQFNLISGEFRRGEVSDRLKLIVFDCVTLEEFTAGRTEVGYGDRMERIDPALASSPSDRYDRVSQFYPGTYGPAQEFCNALVAAGGYDGAIFRRGDGGWIKNKSNGDEVLKLKQVLSFDLRVTGIKEGLGKNAGRAGAICVDFEGNDLWVNCGTDAEREAWWADNSLIVGKIVEIEAMDRSAKGVLREPRFKGIRYDKTEPDT